MHGKLVFDHREAGFGPAAPAAVHGDYVGVAHFLEVVGRQRGAEAAATVENDDGGFVGDGFFDVALDDAFAEVNRRRECGRGPIQFLRGYLRGSFFRRRRVSFLWFRKSSSLMRFFGVGYQTEETFWMVGMAIVSPPGLR